MKKMKRAILIVLDSVGVGCAPDAARYGDEGANTVSHIAQSAPLHLPNLTALGFARIPGVTLPPCPAPVGAYGCMREAAAGKDTTTGHWEMAGLTLKKPFPLYPHGFPREVMDAFESAIGRGTLGNKPASGTQILKELGEEHLRTGKVIVYTSGDSVFQIAANEKIVPVEELYAMCQTARGLLQGEHAVGRVIARPFIGDTAETFARTPRRRDYSLPPTGDTLLDDMKNAGLDVLAVGKIEDIFCLRGITKSDHAAGNPACVDALLRFLRTDFTGLCFVNLVDFDSSFGHRRDALGYAQCLEAFDARLPEILAAMTDADTLYITADHGCDPTFAGTDHTRERVPLLAYHKGMTDALDLGVRDTYADLAATISEQFALAPRYGARSFYQALEGSK